MTYPAKLLKNSNLFAKKELGQNFLADPKTAEHIVNLAKISKDDVVFEIGAGLGALTVHAAKRAYKVYAVERDDRIINILHKELKDAGVDNNVTLIHKDIFKVDIEEIANSVQEDSVQNGTHDGQACYRDEVNEINDKNNYKNIKKFIVIGNLPYNISSQVLFMLVEKRTVISKAVLMFQKELAQRIAAPPGSRDYGRLSAVMQYCSTVRNLTDVGANSFFPKPDVESRVIEVSFAEYPEPVTFQKKLTYQEESFLFQVIKAAFSKRRKTLRNSISTSELRTNKILTEKALAISGIDPERRAETLCVKEFTALAEALKSVST